MSTIRGGIIMSSTNLASFDSATCTKKLNQLLQILEKWGWMTKTDNKR